MRHKAVRILSSPSHIPSGVAKIDIFRRAMRELYFIEHPSARKSMKGEERKVGTFALKRKVRPVWAYYPWLRRAFRIPENDIYYTLLTARNRNLITRSEQMRYRASTIGIAGLSVGSSALQTIVATGGPSHIKLADPDSLEITNLNRIRASLPDVGLNKTAIAAHAAWEIDPFLTLELFDEGLLPSNLKRFIEKPRLDLLIDEMDTIEMKVALRTLCRTRKIPVVMATDNGDGVIVDVERFDIEPKRALFHGRVSISKSDLRRKDQGAFLKLSSAIIDQRRFTERQLESILEVGTTLSGVPQLATAAALAGATIAYVTRQILCGERIPSGRYTLECEETFTSSRLMRSRAQKKAALVRSFAQHFKNL